MKKVVCILSCGLLLAGCGSKTAVIKEGKGTYTNDKKEVTTANVKTKDGKLSEVEIDETANGKDQTKKELGNAYNMKQASKIGKEWYEQIAFLENYIVKNGVDTIKLNSEGKAENNDVKTGCTIRIDGFIQAVKEAEKNAK
ncbi:FMN-binding protein [[Eubacterium] hominis]|uniref:FMN-binding protein n=1 Tax=[Eubacterium] hominis TaxID=2764325 RepID=UPI003A4D8026